MTYYGGKELAAAFRTVRGNTIKIAADIPEDKYDFKAAPEVRSVREMLVHIALGTTFADHIHRNRIADVMKVNFQEIVAAINAEQAQPRTKDQIIELLQKSGEAFASFLESLAETVLAEPVAGVPGTQPRSRFEMLLSAKEHEMHHRGQLMLVERMLGIVPHLTREMQERMARMQAAPSPRA